MDIKEEGVLDYFISCAVFLAIQYSSFPIALVM